jgi:hypothetical protein
MMSVDCTRHTSEPLVEGLPPKIGLKRSNNDDKDK